MKKNISLGVFGICFILLLSFFVSSEFAQTNPQLTRPGYTSVGYLQAQGVSAFPQVTDEQCKTGQDFLVQVSPLGCRPLVVRSDLLEEQNVPVFCPLMATKTNPLITIDAIDSITFSGNYSSGISGIGFHPARASLKNSRSTLLNSPVMENIGYAVIVLKQNPNESSMPNEIKGQLTANLQYDLKNAFGVGQASYYLPELSDSEWESKLNQFTFWKGRGILRATNVEDGSATIEVYENADRRVASYDLNLGQSSPDIYLPGFYCTASMQVQLVGLSTPDTRARFEINGEVVEAAKGESFLDNKCNVQDVEKSGIVQRARVSCKGDDGSKTFELLISPKVKVSYESSGANIVQDYNIGDKLFDLPGSGKAVYIAYVGENAYKEKYMVLAISTAGSADAFRNTYLYRSLPSQMRAQTDTRKGAVSKLVRSGVSALVGSVDYSYKGDMTVGLVCEKETDTCDSDIDLPTITAIVGGDSYYGLVSKVHLLGLSDPQDSSAFGANTNFENAMKDYQRIIENFEGEKQSQSDLETFSEKALFESITLANELKQNAKVVQLCREFESRYPSSSLKSSVNSLCVDDFEISNEEISSNIVNINGETKRISFRGIYEPTYEDYGAEIEVRRQNGGTDVVRLVKDQIYYLPAEKNEGVYVLNGPTPVYAKFYNGAWQLSVDYVSWQNALTLAGLAGGSAAASGFLPAPITAPVAVGSYYYILKTKIIPDLAAKLGNKNLEQGIQVLEQEGAKKANLPTQFIQLKDIKDSKTIGLDVNVKTTSSASSSSILGDPNVNYRVVQKDTPLVLDQYTFIVRTINNKKVAKVAVLPNIRRTSSEANFSFSVGIEKRAVQLSPAQTEKRINQLDKTINQWNDISKNLDKVVSGFKSACLGMGAVLTTKNFFESLGGEALARNEVMTSANGWNKICADKVKNKEYISVDDCLLQNNDKIESDVNKVLGVINSQKTYDEKTIDGQLPDLYNRVDSYLQSSQGAKYSPDLVLQNAFSGKGCAQGKVGVSQAKDLERNLQLLNDASLGPELKSVAESDFKKTISDIRESSQVCSQRQEFATEIEIDPSRVGLLSNAKLREYPYYDTTYYEIKNKVFIPNISDNDPIWVGYLTSGQKMIVPLVGVGNGQFVPKRDGSEILIYDKNGQRVRNLESSRVSELYNAIFKRYDRNTYINSIENPEVKYFETGQYKGLPAIVPFRTKEGWYVAMKETTPINGQIKTYQDSGAVGSFYLCNVGKNRRIDFNAGVNDDICQGFSPVTGINYDSFYGLEKDELNKIYRDSQKAISEASKQYSSGVRSVTILGETIRVGDPSPDIPEMQCQNFMSPQDCWLLFNACDPVVCPSSRCDLGGAFPVKNVVQSGIVGSIALCLPNVREKIIAPVCLTGVKAGVDSLISVFKNYKDCLQHNLDTGETVGICDEVHSIYLCEFFWRQAIPLTEVSFPKLLEFALGQGTRGGGEYLSVQSAFDNANSAVNYIVGFYGASSYNAFKVKLTDEIGSTVCKGYASAVYPSSADLFDTFMGGDSPSQYSGWFSEIPFTTATVPSTSQYKVFYHIYAGKDNGVQYQVYLKGGQGSSYYQSLGSSTFQVASGFIASGDYASETKDFTAETGYQKLCISVNGEENCDFKQVSTDFAVNYLTKTYVSGQARDKEVTKESECVSGSVGPQSLLTLTPNIQEGIDEGINPAIYKRGLVRVCATDNPGRGTDENWNNPKESRWVEVGYCDTERVKCWIDTRSVETALGNAEGLKNATIGDLRNSDIDKILNEGIASGDYIDFEKVMEEIKLLKTPEEKVNFIDDNLISKAFFGNQKVTLLLIRGQAYGELARIEFQKVLAMRTVNQSEYFAGGSSGSCVSPTTNSASCGSGEKILSTAKSFYDQGYNERRIPSDAIGANEKVCARFVTHVVVNAGVKNIDLQEGLCDWDSNQYLIQNLPQKGFVEIPSTQYATGLLPGDIVIFDKLNDASTDHALVFSNYDTDNGRVKGYGDPGKSGPVAFSSYPIDNRNNKYSDRSGWYIYHVFRYNGNDLGGNCGNSVSLGCESCGMGCSLEMCKAINSQCIFTSTSGPTTTTTPTTVSGSCTNDYDSIIQNAIDFVPNKNSNLDMSLVKGLISRESAFNTYAVSSTGCSGLMQFCQQTAESYGLNVQGSCTRNCANARTKDQIKKCGCENDERLNPEKAIPAGIKLINDNLNRANGNVESALRMYTGGSGGDAHVNNILNTAKQIRSNGGKCTGSITSDYKVGTMCEDCGDAWFGVCDAEECNAIGQKTGKTCVYDDGLLFENTWGNCKEVVASKQVNKVALIGDSLTVGYSTVLRSLIGNKLIDSGSYSVGKNTAWMVQTALPSVISAKPDVAVVLGGTNDGLGSSSYSPSLTTSNLENIYKQLSSNGIKVIAVTLPKWGSSYAGAATANQNVLAINNWIKNYCSNNKQISCVDIYDATANSIPVTDVHPSSAGYQKMASMINEKISI